jgi:hypothetical protein
MGLGDCVCPQKGYEVYRNSREKLQTLDGSLFNGRIKEPHLRKSLKLSLWSFANWKESGLEFTENEGVA